MLNRVRLVSGLLLASCMLILGCSNENKEFPAQVSGKVSYKGSPVTGGIITLYTAEGSPIQAPISNNGTYLFPNLPVGQMTVTIDTDSVNPETMKKEDYKGGKYKIISFHAKHARGLMARYAIEKKISTVKKLQGFDREGYAFAPEASQEHRLVFRRSTGSP